MSVTHLSAGDVTGGRACKKGSLAVVGGGVPQAR